jgi:hypothetical protein
MDLVVEGKLANRTMVIKPIKKELACSIAIHNVGMRGVAGMTGKAIE